MYGERVKIEKEEVICYLSGGTIIPLKLQISIDRGPAKTQAMYLLVQISVSA